MVWNGLILCLNGQYFGMFVETFNNFGQTSNLSLVWKNKNFQNKSFGWIWKGSSHSGSQGDWCMRNDFLRNYCNIIGLQLGWSKQDSFLNVGVC